MSSDSEDLSRQSKKRKPLIIDDSSDNSDDSVVGKSKGKRRVLRVVSDGDSSDEDSDVPRTVRRKNGRSTIIISEEESSSDSDAGSLHLESDGSAWESDWHSSDSSDVDEVLPKKPRLSTKSNPSASSSSAKKHESDSDESDGQTDKCPICLLPFKKQQVATPEACDHCFCLLCLTEWSKNVNTCPVDRQPFTFINVRFQPNGKIVQKIPIEPKSLTDDQPQEDPTYCEVCRECDREDRMLLCDGCDLGFHLECLNPPMNEVPMDEWFCPTCAEANPNLAESVEMDLDELHDLMTAARCLGQTYGRTRSGAPPELSHPTSRRIIPRTRQTERVRANIRADRRRQLTFDPEQPSTSSGIDDSNSRQDFIASVIQRVSAAMSRPRAKVKSTGKKSRRKKPRKTTKRTSSTSELREVRIREINDEGEEKEIITYVKVKKTSTKRKTKRTKRTRKKLKRKTSKRRALSSLYGKGVKKRLAITLGMVKGRAKLPNAEPVSNPGTVTSGARYRAGISQVSLFGNNLGLDYSPPGSDDEGMLDNPSATLGSLVAIQRRGVSISSNRRRLALKGMLLEPQPARTAAQHSSLDLLDSIMGSQKLWHSKQTPKITLKANGTLLLPEAAENPPKIPDTPPKIPDLSKPLDSILDRKSESPLDLTKISSEDITQAPMYNGSRGGGTPRGSGGGNRGGNYNSGRDSYSYSYSGRNSYNRGGGPSPRGGFSRERPPGITDFPQNFDNHPGNFNASFRFRNSPNFRNDNRRMPMLPNMPRPPNQMFRGPGDSPIFPITNFPPPLLSQPPPPAPAECSGPQEYPEGEEKIEGTAESPGIPSGVSVSGVPAEGAEKIEEGAHPEGKSAAEGTGGEEDCDIYADIEGREGRREDREGDPFEGAETPKEGDFEGGNSSILLPPPEPPSELLLDFDLKNDDYESNSRGSDKSDKSDNEDLVIDDSHKEPEREVINSVLQKVNEVENEEKPEQSQPKFYDKYDPFTEADSDEESQADCPNFSIYSSETMDVARRAEEQLSQEIGPLEPPPLPPDIPDEDSNSSPQPEAPEEVEDGPHEERIPTPDIPCPSPTFDPYVESLRKERQQLSKIPSKKISGDSRGKITFKIGNKSRVMNKLSSLYDEIDDNIETMIEQEREQEAAPDKPPAEQKESVALSPKPLAVVEKEPEVSPQPAHEEEALPQPEEEEKICSEPEEEPDARTDKSDDEEEVDDQAQDDVILNDSASTEESERGGTPPILACKSISDNCLVSESSDIIPEDESFLSQDFQLEKDEQPKDGEKSVEKTSEAAEETWYSDGAYTPCKDENPVEKEPKSPFESGLEPITPPPKDLHSDDLDGCRTPIGYAGLGTEAISETDEPINFEDEPSGASPSTRKNKEMEDGEISLDESRPSRKKSFDSETDGKRRKERREKSTGNKDADKNKENTSNNHQVSWKKLSKSTKERQYREKMKARSTSKDRQRIRNRDRDRDRDYDKEKSSKRRKSKDRQTDSIGKEAQKKKEKRKELPRYDVRKVVAEKPSRPKKDEYGRDVRATSRSRSRQRSFARGSHSYSPRRSWPRRLSRSWSNHRRRSLSRPSRPSSRSRSRRSRSRSLSRSYSRSRSRRKSPIRRRSGSRKRSRSLTPRRNRRSLTPRRKTHAKRLPIRKRKSRSRSRKKEKVKKHKSRSRSRRRKRSWSKSPQPAVRREKEKKRVKRKFVEKSRSRERSLEHWEGMNPPRALDRAYMRTSGPLSLLSSGMLEQQLNPIPNPTWSGAQWTPSWSRSKTKSRSRSRSPVADLEPVPPKNLTVILTNKEAIKKKKREKRLKERKRREEERAKKRDKRNRSPQPSKEVFASGDNILVSVCFNNDSLTDGLMDKNQAAIPNGDSITSELADTIAMLTSKRRKRRNYREVGMAPMAALAKEPIAKKPKKDKAREKRNKSPDPKPRRREKKKKSKAAEIAAGKKPVAVIDLDQSPFREQTPSPKDIIVLSDDEDDNDSNQQQQQSTPTVHQQKSDSRHEEQSQQQDTQSEGLRDEFVGPKTPPEPQIKFSISKQSNNLRPSMMNPLLDEEDGDQDVDADDTAESHGKTTDDKDRKSDAKLNDQSDLNTSDPSRESEHKQTEGAIIVDSNEDLDDLEAMEILEMNERTHQTDKTAGDMEERSKHSEERRNQDEIDMRLKIGPNTPPEPPSSPPTSPDAYDPFDPTKSRSPTPTASLETPTGIDSGLTNDSKVPGKENFAEKRETDKPKIISMVTIKRGSSPASNLEKVDDKKSLSTGLNPFTTINPVLATVAAAVQRIGIQRSLAVGQSKQRAPVNQVSNIFMNSVKGMNLRAKGNKQNGNEGVESSDALLIDTSSPYSPGSSLSDGIFDPPSYHGYTSPVTNSANSASKGKKKEKKDAFDALFGSSPLLKSGKGRGKKNLEKRRKATNSKVGVRMDENELQILDDLPSSAVEMQVKDKFLKKLNRQERVVEEVKLVLKPHYTKKHVTKEEYKDIMRKAVPKICHNKTGEINPKKIAHLVEAYVRKCRNYKKKGTNVNSMGNSVAKNLRTTKTLWS